MKDQQENVVYLADRKPKVKRRRLKIFNIAMLFLALYFIFSIGRQELKLHQIKKEKVEVQQQYEDLKLEESLLEKKLSESSSDSVTENQAKEILGWVKNDEIKVLEKNE